MSLCIVFTDNIALLLISSKPLPFLKFRLLFLAGERKTFDRIGNYHQISEKLNLPAQYKGSATDCTDR